MIRNRTILTFNQAYVASHVAGVLTFSFNEIPAADMTFDTSTNVKASVAKKYGWTESASVLSNGVELVLYTSLHSTNMKSIEDLKTNQFVQTIEFTPLGWLVTIMSPTGKVFKRRRAQLIAGKRSV
jgi:hypothetical protein